MMNNSDDDEDEDYDLSSLDEEYLELQEDEIVDDEDEDFEYFYKLDDPKKHLCIETLKKSQNVNKKSVPLKFKILESKMDLQTKSVAIHNVEKMNDMDPSSGEFNKMDKWISGLLKSHLVNIQILIFHLKTLLKKKEILFVTPKKL